MITKKIAINILVPNNFYINEEKLKNVRNAYRENKAISLPPVLVGIIENDYALIDGHSRAMAAIEYGENEILAQIVPIEEITGPTELYLTIHKKAKEMNLTSVYKLKNRIISSKEHKLLWVKYCEDLINELYK